MWRLAEIAALKVSVFLLLPPPYLRIISYSIFKHMSSRRLNKNEFMPPSPLLIRTWTLVSIYQITKWSQTLILEKLQNNTLKTHTPNAAFVWMHFTKFFGLNLGLKAINFHSTRTENFRPCKDELWKILDFELPLQKLSLGSTLKWLWKSNSATPKTSAIDSFNDWLAKIYSRLV